MKKMEPLLLILTLMLTLSLQSYSQNFGLKAGLNLSDMLFKDNDGKIDNKMITGINLGATAEFPVSEMLSFETGLIISTKGTKRNELTYYYGEMHPDLFKVKITYLDIPLNTKARFEVNGLNIFGVFGPYIGIGLGGQMYVNGDGTKIKWGQKTDNTLEDGDDLKRLDFGLNIGGGVELNDLQMGLTYSLGLANISPDTSYGTKIGNRLLSISVGYKFGSIKLKEKETTNKKLNDKKKPLKGQVIDDIYGNVN